MAKTTTIQPPSMAEIESFVKNEQDLGLAPAQIMSDLYEFLREKLSQQYYGDSVVHGLATTLYHSAVKNLAAAIHKEQLDAAARGKALEQNKRILLLTKYIAPVAEFVKTDPDQPKATTDSTIKLLAAFLTEVMTNYHPTGWLRYNRKSIFSLASVNTRSVADQEKITKKLHDHYQLLMRVVGSNQPIPCFKFSWFEAPTTEDLSDMDLLIPEDTYADILNILGGYLKYE